MSMARDFVTEPSPSAEPKVSAADAASVSRAASHLRPEQYPMLCDYEHDHVGRDIAPDGRPWRKACSDCAFRTNDPQGLGAGYQDAVANCDTDFVFYCVHREDDGLTRICACWAALRVSRAAPKIEARRAEMRSSSVEDESLVTEGQAPSNPPIPTTPSSTGA